MVLEPKQPSSHKDSSLLPSPHGHTGLVIIFFTAPRLVSSPTRWNQPLSRHYHRTRWNLSSRQSCRNNKLRLDLEITSPIPSFASHWMYAPVYTSNETLTRVHLGSTQVSPPDPRSQVDLNLRVDQLTQRMDDQIDFVR
ncbi:unnamed protein product [Prunus armeniaca]